MIPVKVEYQNNNDYKGTPDFPKIGTRLSPENIGTHYISANNKIPWWWLSKLKMSRSKKSNTISALLVLDSIGLLDCGSKSVILQ